MPSLLSLAPVVAALLAYLIGSLSFAVLVSRAMGLRDPRTCGSQNPGATNVLRSGSKAAAVVTLLLDAAKGWLPVALVGLAAFLGHLYPVFFGFAGGKGVATALGVLVGVHWGLGLAAAATWVLIAFFFRYSSLASLAAAVFAPLYYLFGNGVAWAVDAQVAVAITAMAGLLMWRHAENISRLVKGTESRLGQKPKPPKS